MAFSSGFEHVLRNICWGICFDFLKCSFLLVGFGLALWLALTVVFLVGSFVLVGFGSPLDWLWFGFALAGKVITAPECTRRIL